jgi:hypothetical protein
MPSLCRGHPGFAVPKPKGKPMRIFGNRILVLADRPCLAGAILLTLLASAPLLGFEQTIGEIKKYAPKVFIDCHRCDMNYIRTEIPFVNYVRNPQEADIHVLVTEQTTGGGGREYTLTFIGLGRFADLKNTLTYYSNRVDTEDEMRKGLVQILKLGLAPYVARTPMAKFVNFSVSRQVTTAPPEDAWNYWVFNLSTRLRARSEQTQKSASVSGSASVSRVTPASKFRVSAWADYQSVHVSYEDTDYRSSSTEKSLESLYVRSVDDHWSVGGYVNWSASTYSNVAFSLAVMPAVEFDLFPYSESTRRQLRFLYTVGFSRVRYIDETIYDRTAQSLWRQGLSVTLEFVEPWGSGEISLEGSNFFHDFSKNRLVTDGEIYLRIFRGLSLNVDARYSLVRDQLNIAKGDATLDEILLQRRELASNYRMSLSIGLSYSFGSVYSNIVNPRFGSSHTFDSMHF